MRLLFAYAAPQEIGELASELPGALELGVGKSHAAARAARALAAGGWHAVVLFGVAGTYADSRLAVGDLCVVGSSVLADEGVEAESGFTPLEALGLASPEPSSAYDARLAATAASALALGAPVRAATVSTCSGRDALAAARAARTGAAIETMESAAVALACADAGIPLVELRCVSNRCGDRARAGWDLPGAVARLGAAVRRLVAEKVLDVR